MLNGQANENFLRIQGSRERKEKTKPVGENNERGMLWKVMGRRKRKHLMESEKKGGRRSQGDQKAGSSSLTCLSREPKCCVLYTVKKAETYRSCRVHHLIGKWTMGGSEEWTDWNEIQPGQRKTVFGYSSAQAIVSLLPASTISPNEHFILHQVSGMFR